MEAYNKFKYKNGQKTLISQRTWEMMSDEDRMMYSDYKEERPKELGGQTVEIEIKPKSKEEILKEIEKLQAELNEADSPALFASEEELSGEHIIDAGDNGVRIVDPYSLEFEDLQKWLTAEGIEYKATIKKLETLQKLIP